MTDLHPFDDPRATYDDLVRVGLPGCTVTRCFRTDKPGVHIAAERYTRHGIRLSGEGTVWQAGVDPGRVAQGNTPRAALTAFYTLWREQECQAQNDRLVALDSAVSALWQSTCAPWWTP